MDPPGERGERNWTVLDEVGVLEEGKSATFWKAIQRIKKGDQTLVKTAYWKYDGEEWDDKPGAAMLEPAVYSELHARAVTEGILERR
jgi:hypothetical protein